MAVTQAELEQLYVAYFGRPADYDGLVYYTNKPGITIWDVAAAFGNSPESQALYGPTANAAMIKAIYNNLFNRDPENGATDYWLGQIAKGILNPGSVALGILLGAQNEDKIAVQNKLAIANSFTNGLDTLDERIGYAGADAAASARAFLHTVTSTADSLTAAQSGLDAAITAAVGAGKEPVPMSLSLTTGLDDLHGGAGNDTFAAVDNGVGLNGTTLTLNAGDAIDGGAGNDLLKVTVTNTAAGIFGAAVTTLDLTGVSISNVENFAVQNTTDTLGAVDLAGNAFSSVSLSGMQGGSINVDNAQAGSAISVQGTKSASSDVTVNASDETNTSVTVSDTFVGTGSKSQDAYVQFNNDLVAATTVDATLNANKMNGDSEGYSWVDQYISTGAADAAITANVNITGATSDGSDYSGVSVYVQHDGSAAVTLNATIANSDSVELDVYADDNGNSTAAPTNVANITLSNVKNTDYSEVYLSTFGTVNLTVDGKSSLDDFDTYANDSSAAYETQTLNITANADLSIGSTDLADAGSVSVVISGSGNVDLGSYDGTYDPLTDTLTDTIDASGLTGKLTVDASTAVTSITGGSNDDSISVNGFDAVSSGAGNDTITLKGGGAPGQVDGGAGLDTLAGTSAVITGIDNSALAAADAWVGLEAVKVTDALAADLDTTKIQAGINTVTLAQGGGGSVTVASGASTVNLGAALTGSLSVVSSGTGTGDLVTIVNTAASVDADADAATPKTAVDVFAGQAINATGVENLVLDGTGNGAATKQMVGGVSGSASTNVKFVGSNSFEVTSTIDAKAVDASALTGSAALKATSAALTTLTGAGKDDITLTAATTAAVADDPLTVANEAKPVDVAYVSTGAGDDKITVDTAAAASNVGNITIDAGAGNDTVAIISRSTGKLTVNLGDGNDTFTSAVAVNATDVIDAGAGVDKLSLSLVGSANVGAFSNFDVLDAASLNKALDVEILATKNVVTEIIASGDVGATASLISLGAGVGFRATADIGTANAITLSQKTAGALTVTVDADETGTADAAIDTASAKVIAANATSVAAVFDTSYLPSIVGETAAGDNVTTLDLTTSAATSLSVVSGGANATNVLTVTDAAATAGKLASISITGADHLALNFSATNPTALASIDASGQTGGLTASLDALKNLGSITLGSGTDAITVSSASTTGAMESIVGLEKTAAVAVSVDAADATAKAAAIASADVLVLTGAAVASDVTVAASYSVAKGVLTFLGAGPSTLGAAFALADTAAETAGEAVVFEYLGNSYVFAQGATDVAVKLTGVTGVTNLVEDGTTDHFFIV